METQYAAREDFFPFLSLPPEVRNRIHALLFEHEDPIYAGKKSRKTNAPATMHCRVGDCNERLLHPQQTTKAFSYMFNRVVSPFVSVTLPGFALFFVCRQIYNETSSMFYKNNTFAVSPVRCRYDVEHEFNGEFMGREAVPWLRRLGSRASMLNILQIDIDALCPSDCLRNITWFRYDTAHKDMLDFGPLLNLIWNQNLRLNVTIVHSKNEAHEKLFPEHGNWHRLDSRPHCNLSALNEIVRSLQIDTLGIKHLRRVIGLVGVKRDGSGGSIIFLTDKPSRGSDGAAPPNRGSSSHHYEQLFERTYLPIQKKHHPIIHRRSWKEYSDALAGACHHKKYPEHVLNRIMDHVFTNPKKHVLSLDNPWEIWNSLKPARVNREWYSEYKHYYFFGNKFAIEMRCGSKPPHFFDFDRLSRQIRSVVYGYQTQGEDNEWPRYIQSHIYEITIVFDLTTQHGVSTTLADLRFNITPIIEATSDWDNDAISIRIITKEYQHNKLLEPTVNDTIMTLGELRRKVLQAWSQPALLPEGQQKMCPKLWIDSTGCVINVVESESCVPFRSQWYDDQEWEKSHKQKKVLLEKSKKSLEGPYRAGWPLPHDNSAFQTWWYLRWQL